MIRAFAVVLVLCGCTSTPPVCRRMEALCNTKREDCEVMMKNTREGFGDEAVAGVTACFNDAQTCEAATGCVAGKSLKRAADGAKTFFNAVGEELKKK